MPHRVAGDACGVLARDAEAGKGARAELVVSAAGVYDDDEQMVRIHADDVLAHPGAAGPVLRAESVAEQHAEEAAALIPVEEMQEVGQVFRRELCGWSNVIGWEKVNQLRVEGRSRLDDKN